MEVIFSNKFLTHNTIDRRKGRTFSGSKGWKNNKATDVSSLEGEWKNTTKEEVKTVIIVFFI